jgi:hypothetical protein
MNYLNPFEIILSALRSYITCNGVSLATPVEALQLHGRVAMFKIGEVWHTAMAYEDRLGGHAIDFADYDGYDLSEQALKKWLDAPRESRDYMDAEYTTYDTDNSELHVPTHAKGNPHEMLRYFAASYLMKKAGTVKANASEDEYF